MAGNLAIVGGTLLFIGGATGMGIFQTIKTFLMPHLEGETAEIVGLILEILILLALLGGITVIVGGYLIKTGKERIGKILITIGCGTGVLSIIIAIIVAMGSGDWGGFMAGMLSITGIGTVLSLVAKYMA